MRRVLVLGGYGVFGRRVAERLARRRELAIIVAGRDGERARLAADALRATARAAIGHAAIDVGLLTERELRGQGAHVLINAVGPYQSQDYALAKTCIAAGVHYVDLADARAFVCGITALDEAARRAGVLVTSGASSVPALSAAVVDRFLPLFGRLESIEHSIAPGNTANPGEGTVASMLMGAGRPYRTRVGGADVTLRNWLGLTRRVLPDLGRRWLADVDVPDHGLFPARYPDLRTVRFRAGLEVAAWQWGLWTIGQGARLGLLRRPERLARSLNAVKRGLSWLGTDTGGMHMRLSGRDASGRAQVVTWRLVAGSGHGLHVPATPAAIIADKLARGRLDVAGAVPCVGLMTLDEFTRATEGLDIRQVVL